ncbi:microsomal signal peptidase 25 kDa subunit-domain-containing protein [Phellopilus nigrolimitatus]|nr:microsomal signal peptidase 25 kDa subunit-domain-containing protein [Phellopilus nigrolimitatus]
MARRKAANGVAKSVEVKDVSSSSVAVDTTKSSTGASTSGIDILAASTGAAREPIKVNNMNLADLKNACDDAVKKLLSQPDLFQENHQHTDVKLALGWASVLVAGGTALYGWKAEFEVAKPLVWAGVILYVILTAASTLYSFFVEKNTVYVGRRKTLAKRIETERITVASRTLPAVAARVAPRYHVSVSYMRSSNGGKSLLGRGQSNEERAYTEFFDEEGTMDQERFDRWVGALVERVMDGR